MLVYGDPARLARPAALLARIRAAGDEARAAPPGIARHGRLVSALIEAGALAQGLADAAFEARGHVDDLHPVDADAMALCLALARAVAASWDAGLEDDAPPALSEPSLAALERRSLPETVRAKVPEGYAFYALYPEAVLAAARRLAPGLAPDGPVRVVGIRSIGTSLAAVAAVALGDPEPVTVRPVGDPFRRELRLSPALAAHLTARPGGVVVVDEGPGLSGSSFGAVADALERLGVPRARIAFLPSHGGDLGPQASPGHRARWAGARRPAVGFDELVGAPAHGLGTWAEDLVGPAVAPLVDLAGGAWRALVHGPDESRWPPAAAQAERRKFLLRTATGAYLLKFAGLGAAGEAAAETATALSEAGFVPAVLGLRHGFLVQAWREDVRPFDPAGPGRAAGLAHLARYLALRDRRFPRPPEAGAPGALLLEMIGRNVGLALGDAAARAAADRAAALAGLDAGLRRIATDGRLHAHEWLAGPDGRLWKADAVDHHAAHDLVGAQDLAWDVAGAEVEWTLSPAESAALVAAIEAEGARVDRARLAALRPAYLAFQLGRSRMAADALAGWPAEAGRLGAEARRYEEALRAWLQGTA